MTSFGGLSEKDTEPSPKFSEYGTLSSVGSVKTPKTSPKIERVGGGAGSWRESPRMLGGGAGGRSRSSVSSSFEQDGGGGNPILCLSREEESSGRSRRGGRREGLEGLSPACGRGRRTSVENTEVSPRRIGGRRKSVESIYSEEGEERSSGSSALGERGGISTSLKDSSSECFPEDSQPRKVGKDSVLVSFVSLLNVRPGSLS